MLPKLKSLNLVTPDDFQKQAKEVFGDIIVSKRQPENDADQIQGGTLAKTKAEKLTWTTTGVHETFKQFNPPHWLMNLKDDTQVVNFIYTSLSFFYSATISKPNPAYTWLDIPVPDQLIDRLGCKVITVDGTTKGLITMYR